MDRRLLVGCAAFVAALLTPSAARAVTLTPIFGPGDFTSSVTYSNDFESVINTPQFTFEPTVQRDSAGIWTGGVTSSGEMGLVENVGNEPLRVVMTAPVREVGLFFGNDDFGYQFDAKLEVFDVSNVSLGSRIVPANRNDWCDQYLGLRSDTPIKSIEISYQRPDAQVLSIFIDDLKVGIVPEPAGIGLVIIGLAGWCFGGGRARTRRTAGRF